MVTNRMEMIERIDKHPLSWPVATEFQKLKRAKTGSLEDEKLFLQAEKKVADDRKKREEAVGGQRASTARGFDRFHYSKRQTPGFFFCCFVLLRADYLVKNVFFILDIRKKLRFLIKKYGVSCSIARMEISYVVTKQKHLRTHSAYRLFTE